MIKIKKSSLYVFGLSLCLCLGYIVNISSIYINSYWFSRLFLLSGLLLLLPGLKYYFQKKYFCANTLMILTIGSVAVSAVLNFNDYSGIPWVAVSLCLQLLMLIWYCEFLDSTNNTDCGIVSLFWIVFTLCILSDVLMIVDPHRTYYSWGGFFDTFLVGNKFALTYLHLLCTVLFIIKSGKNDTRRKFKIALLLIWQMAVSAFSLCATMIVGTAVFAILLIFGKRIIHILQDPVTALVSLVFCDTILLLRYSFTKIPLMQFIIKDVLNRSGDITGRESIYSRIPDTVSVNPLFGVGIDNNFSESLRLVSAADVQNGILDIRLSYGWIGVVILILFLVYVVSKSGKSLQNASLQAIYVYIVLSSVEVPFQGIFYLYLMLTLLYSWKNPDDALSGAPFGIRVI